MREQFSFSSSFIAHISRPWVWTNVLNLFLFRSTKWIFERFRPGSHQTAELLMNQMTDHLVERSVTLVSVCIGFSAGFSPSRQKPWNVLVQLSDDGGTEDWSHCWGVTVTQFRSQVQSVGWKQQDSTLPLIIAPFVAVLSWAETCRWSCPPLQMHLWVTAHTMIRTIMYLVSPKMESFLWFSPLLQTRTSSDASAIRFGCDTPQALR